MTQMFAGKVAVITGAAKGIGRSAALEFAAKGAAIALFDRDEKTLAATAQEIRDAGVPVVAVCGDAARIEDLDRLFTEVDASLGRVDALVNNAAFSTREPFLAMKQEDLQRTMDVSLWGALHCSRAAAARMLAKNHAGSIVMVSSVHAGRPYPNALGYNAAKAALNHAAASMAQEWAAHGIRVNTIEPGWIDTPGEHIYNSEEEIAERGKLLPFGRLGQPEEVAKAISFLCSEDASYITGAVLRVDGGFALRF